MSAQIPCARRFYHWVNLICMIALGITGWYIHKPFLPDAMGLMRSLHFLFMYIFAINLLLRIYYAFGKNGDWEKYLKPQINKETIFAMINHYLLYKPLPEGDKYRILQNASYLGIVLLFFVQIFTGISIYDPEKQVFANIILSFGGINFIRQVHFFLLWVFMAFTIIHMYMAFAEEWSKVKLIFFGIEEKKASNDINS